MSAYSFYNFNTKVGAAIAGGGASGTLNGASVDTKGTEEALVVLNVGVIPSSGTLDVKVQHSATNTVWADLSGASFTQIAQADDESVHIGRIVLNRSSVNRYLRIVGVDTNEAIPYGACIILGGDQYRPVTQPNTIDFELDETS